jgi:5-formyltetrahydrofolate cyclo-ligase
MNKSSTFSDKNANTQGDEDYSRNALRQIFREKRNALTPHQQILAAKGALSQAINHNLFINCKRVGIYLTNEGELNTQPIIEYLWEQGVNVFLPVLHPFSNGYLVFLQYTPSTKMKPNVYGILEPLLDVTKLCPIAQLDMILAPLVAFDEKGNRMGMGGGFYDRTIKHIANKDSMDAIRKTRLIGLAHDVQHTLSLPTQVWDIPLPAILTPTTLYSF